MDMRSSLAGVKAAEGERQHEIMVQQADVRLNRRDHVVESVHLHPALAALNVTALTIMPSAGS
jgi:hypothetical protein